MGSFDSNKRIIFSINYRLWLIRRKAFYRHCIPRSLSINDTAGVRNLYPKKFHPWCKTKKVTLRFADFLITFEYRNVLEL